MKYCYLVLYLLYFYDLTRARALKLKNRTKSIIEIKSNYFYMKIK